MKKFSVALALSVIACVGEELDVGSDTGGAGGAPSAAQQQAATLQLPSWATVGACPTTGEPAPQFVGTWEGAVEDFFLNPLTPLRLVVTQATSTGICGTLAWGTDSPPPLPLTDPAQTGREFGYGGGTGFPVEGLTYTIVMGAGRDETLRFSISDAEPWQGFCAMQDTFYYYPNLQSYTCLPPYVNLGINQDSDVCTLYPSSTSSDGATTLPLKQCAGCDGPWGPCVCNAEACAANPQPSSEFALVLGSTLDGNDVLATNSELLGQQAIHLERVE